MYYTKQEVQDYFSTQLKMIEQDQEKYRLIGTAEDMARQFLDGNEILGIFWTTHQEKEGEFEVKMNGKAFVQIESDLYTDDRFALDSVKAMQEGKTVGDVVRERQEQQAKAQQAIQDRNPQDLISLFKDES